MKNQKGFVQGRMKSFVYAFRGTKILVSSEHSIIAQGSIGILSIILGLYFGINRFEWMFQIFAIGLVLTAEGLNTAIEKLCDHVHPDWHEQIKKVKDISAGAITFAATTSVIIAIFIYYPYVLEKFF